MMLRRDWEILGQFKLPLGMLIASVVYGTLGYVAIFGWAFIDALYMTVTTLTTVGFREVQPVDSVGAKLFTISLLVVGISALFAGIGVFANMIGSGELQAIIRRRGVRRQVAGLSDHYIVCAYGRVGRSVVEELRRQGASVMVVDIDPGLEARLQADGVPYLIADPSEEGVLQRGGPRARARPGLRGRLRRGQRVHHADRPVRSTRDLTIVARAARRQSLQALRRPAPTTSSARTS